MNKPRNFDPNTKVAIWLIFFFIIFIATYCTTNILGLNGFWQWTILGWILLSALVLIITNLLTKLRLANIRSEREAENSPYFQERKKLQEEASKRTKQ